MSSGFNWDSFAYNYIKLLEEMPHLKQEEDKSFIENNTPDQVEDRVRIFLDKYL